jgi:hypothetical protein
MRIKTKEDSTKRVIRDATASLVGKALWGCRRAADLAAFQFGEKREVSHPRVGQTSVGEYALHVQCPWRITRFGCTVVGSSDLYYPAENSTSEEYEDEFDWQKYDNRRDLLIRSLFDNGSKTFVVLSIDVGSAGLITLRLTDDMCLNVFPDSFGPEEQWRLLRPETGERHFVVTGNDTHLE